MKATLVALLAIASLPVGCGCRGTTVGSGGNAVLPGTTPATEPTTTEGGGPGPIGGAGPVVPPAPPEGVPEDPTPPRLRAHFDALDSVLETEALDALEKQADAECLAHPDDPTAWIASASTLFQRIVLTLEKPGAPDLQPVRDRVAKARAADRAGHYAYLCLYLDGRLAHIEERREDALRGYQETIRLAPGFARPRLPLAGLLISSGRRNEGEAILIEATHLFPDRWEVWDAIATLRASERKFEEALQALDRACKCAPESFKVRSKLLGLLQMLWRDQPNLKLKERILAENAAVTALVNGAFANVENRRQMKEELAVAADTLQASWAQFQIATLDRLPAAERAFAALFGPIGNFRLRGRVAQAVADRIADAPEPAVKLLMDVATQDAHETVRVFALRCLWSVQIAGRERLRPAPERARVAQLAQEALVALAVAPGTPELVRQNAFEALQNLPVDAAVVGRPLVAYLETLFAAWPAAGPIELAAYAPIETLGRALQTIRGLGAPAPPPRDAETEQRQTYLAGWKAWAEALPPPAAPGGR